MATARPGWSRRAQYSLFFSFLALIAGILVGLFLLALSLLAPARFESVRGAALDITGPIASGLHEVTATAAGLVTGAGDYWDAAGQNGKLKRDAAAMRRQILQAKAIVQENRQLKATLHLREPNTTRSPSAGWSVRRSTARAASRSCRSGQATACASECRCARPTVWSAGWSMPAHWQRASCSFPTTPTSFPRGYCAAGSR